MIRTAFDKLRTGTAAVPGLSDRPAWSGPTVAELVAGEESSEVEFKQTGVGQHAESGKPRFPSDNIVKTVAAFLNSSHGGTLAIGISDDKHVIGLEADFQVKGMDIDKYLNAVTSGLVSACGAGPVTLHTRARAEQVDGKWVVLIDISPSSKPVFARTGKQEEIFYVRANNTTRQLGIAEAPAHPSAARSPATTAVSAQCAPVSSANEQWRSAAVRTARSGSGTWQPAHRSPHRSPATTESSGPPRSPTSRTGRSW